MFYHSFPACAPKNKTTECNFLEYYDTHSTVILLFIAIHLNAFELHCNDGCTQLFMKKIQGISHTCMFMRRKYIQSLPVEEHISNGSVFTKSVTQTNLQIYRVSGWNYTVHVSRAMFVLQLLNTLIHIYYFKHTDTLLSCENLPLSLAALAWEPSEISRELPESSRFFLKLKVQYCAITDLWGIVWMQYDSDHWNVWLEAHCKICVMSN